MTGHDRCPRPDKIAYPNGREAWRAFRLQVRENKHRAKTLAAHGGADMRPYRCQCGAWHVGHAAKQVTA